MVKERVCRDGEQEAQTRRRTKGLRSRGPRAGSEASQAAETPREAAEGGGDTAAAPLSPREAGVAAVSGGQEVLGIPERVAFFKRSTQELVKQETRFETCCRTFDGIISYSTWYLVFFIFLDGSERVLGLKLTSCESAESYAR